MPKFKVYKNTQKYIVVESASVRHVQNEIDFIPFAIVRIDNKGRVSPNPGYYYPGDEPTGDGWQ